MKTTLLALITTMLFTHAQAEERATIASKIFTESYILGEIAAQSLERTNSATVDRKLGMGSTGVLFESLRSGAIDVYPDYTGTLAEAILKRPELKSQEEIAIALLPLGYVISKSLGFDDTYALAVKESFAEKNDLRTISDLSRVQGTIRSGFSYEFMDRADGFRGILRTYRLDLPRARVRRMEHSLAYQAIDDGSVDLIDVYSTDAKIEKLNLRVLKDDLGYFPKYQAVWVARKVFVDENPELWKTLLTFESRIDEKTMIALNAEADIDRKPIPDIASKFLGHESSGDFSLKNQLFDRTLEHLRLVGVALLFSILAGIPLGIAAVRFRLAGQAILIVSALVQTIPSLALLCFLIPLFGVGTKPALAALCLYSLLPVVLNTFTGIKGVESRHIENAKAFGLTNSQILWRIILPIASPTILAGIKTATIVSIGTATLAALIGAGGYGAIIISGLSLNDMRTVLSGAIPSAAMALLAYVGFAVIERVVISAGLRSQR